MRWGDVGGRGNWFDQGRLDASSLCACEVGVTVREPAIVRNIDESCRPEVEYVARVSEDYSMHPRAEFKNILKCLICWSDCVTDDLPRAGSYPTLMIELELNFLFYDVVGPKTKELWWLIQSFLGIWILGAYIMYFMYFWVPKARWII